ncbi:hypothetical protein KQI89_14700 [Clostridium sp. MSJ-4]|uniref:Reverse transcriptase domain-containing protein n=1 Tax=Clostridium simiarum TaxID=2841506 RepID=A0ABS6F414_9CLOT|nr:hypothetical protein [Clostridium simiarum]MBU5592998.1 hypothetical protein [Clostridium simiarum]
MKLVSEITRALNHINAQIKINDMEHKKDEGEIKIIAERVLTDLKSNSFNFSQASPIILKQGTKKRLAKRFVDDFSTENILCQCIKQILDKEFKIKYPNRNKISKSLFNAIGTIKHMSDFTIVKFDFKDYFNSISSVYVYDKIIKSNLSDRFKNDLINKFVTDTKYAFAGLQTSNVIAEIIGNLFDEEVLKDFSSFGLIFYERYIDDGIIVLNEYLPESKCKEMLLNAIAEVFHDKLIHSTPNCTTKMNAQKFKYIAKRNIINNQKYTVDFLGYEFVLEKKSNSIEVKYGITDAKKDKYKKRIETLITLFSDVNSPDYKKLELLRHRLLAFSCREVYITKKFKSDIWKVKGFISNYGELRYLLNTGLVESDTETFLKDVIYDSFSRLGLAHPYFLKGDSRNAYSLYHNMLQNKTLLFEPHIGYSEIALSNLCKKIDISLVDSLGHRRGYGTLVRDYLIKTKVGY